MIICPFCQLEMKDISVRYSDNTYVDTYSRCLNCNIQYLLCKKVWTFRGIFHNEKQINRLAKLKAFL